MVGAVNRIVALNFCIDSSSESGVNFSTSAVLAPKRSGKHSSPPRPKVKASGGEPMKTSSCAGFRQERGKQSHIAITSRWKCIVPLGFPVVPDVNAISATSSAEVATLVNQSGCLSASESTESAASSCQYLASFSEGQTDWACFSSSSRR